jgi:hypothetical protein
VSIVQGKVKPLTLWEKPIGAKLEKTRHAAATTATIIILSRFFSKKSNKQLLFKLSASPSSPSLPNPQS